MRDRKRESRLVTIITTISNVAKFQGTEEKALDTMTKIEKRKKVEEKKRVEKNQNKATTIKKQYTNSEVMISHHLIVREIKKGFLIPSSYSLK